MKTALFIIAATSLLAVSVIYSQQTPTQQPLQVSKPTPCTAPKPADPSTQVQIKPKSRLQLFIEKQRATIEQKSGITPPDVTLGKLAKDAQTPDPCVAPPPPPQAQERCTIMNAEPNGFVAYFAPLPTKACPASITTPDFVTSFPPMAKQ